MVFAAKRGFAYDTLQLCVTAAGTACEQESKFKSELPSMDWVQAFRERYRDVIPVQALLDQDIAKISAESDLQHVNTLKTALQDVLIDDPKIKTDTRLNRNMDETEICLEMGKENKVCASKNRTHVTTRARKGNGKGKHLSAVLLCNARGNMLHLFLIFEGKNQQEHWFHPVDKTSWEWSGWKTHWFNELNWFPEIAVTVPSPKVSMLINIIDLIMDHIRDTWHPISVLKSTFSSSQTDMQVEKGGSGYSALFSGAWQMYSTLPTRVTFFKCATRT